MYFNLKKKKKKKKKKNNIPMMCIMKSITTNGWKFGII